MKALIFISQDYNYKDGDKVANITNYLNEIKSAVYGKDVRSSIHDAIKQVYDDASVNHDNANMEVKMARGTHNTLNERLDNVDEIQAQTNAQLSAKIQEVASTGTTTEVLKATTENYIQDKIEDGTLANLTIEDNSITADKIKCIIEYKNLANVSLIEVGQKYYASSYNAVVKTGDSNYGCFPKIKLFANNTYAINNYSGNFSLLVDKNENVINKLNEVVVDNKFTVTQDCYLYLSINITSDYSELMLVQDEIPDKFYQYDEVIKTVVVGLDIEVEKILYNPLLSDETSYQTYNALKSVYRAKIKNPLEKISIGYSETPIKILVSFEQGECKNEKCIEVLCNGSKVPFQFEENEVKNPIQFCSNGRYFDGSLKDGCLWVMIDSLEPTAEKIFTIKIYETEIEYGYDDNFIFAQEETRDVLLLDNLEFRFGRASSYLLTDIMIDGVQYSKFDVRVKDNNKSYTANSEENTTIIDNYPLGNGVIYKDYISKFKLKYNENIVITTKTRIFVNGEIRIISKVESLSNLDAGILNGISFRAWNYGNSITKNSDNNAVYSGNVGVILHDIQLEPNGAIGSLKKKYDEFKTLTVDVSGSNDNRIDVGFDVGNDAIEVAKNDSWSCYFIYKITSKSTIKEIDAESFRLMNPLICRASKNSSYINKIKLREMMKDYILRGHNSTLSDTFKGCEIMELIAYQEITGEDIQNLIDEKYISMMNTYYGGVEGLGIWEAYKNGRGIEYIGRDMVCVKYLRDIYLRANRPISAQNATNCLHNLANFYIDVEYMSGNQQYNGNINLGYSTNYANPDGVNVPNAQGAALRDIKNSLDIEENEVRRNCYDRIRARFLESNQFHNISPHVRGTLVYRFPEWHYEFFASFDYGNNCDKEYSTTQRVYECTDASGAFDEFRGNYYSDKRGLSHGYLYAIGILIENGDVGDFEQAVKIMDVLLRDTYADNNRQLWIDGWNSDEEINKKDQIALAVASEILLEKLGTIV